MKKIFPTKLRRFLMILLLLSLFPQTVQAFDEPYIFTADESININVYEKIAPSVVTVMADAKKGASSGSGIIVSQEGHIVTSRHVVGKAHIVTIETAQGTRLTGRVVSLADEFNDLALIKVVGTISLPAARLGDSSRIKVGQKVLAIGNPYGFERTLTTGIISRIDTQRNRIQTDASINPGSSGGPLLNSRGEVIGINQSIYNPENSKSNIGISFAVPVNTAKRLLQALPENIPPSKIGGNNGTLSKNCLNVNREGQTGKK